GGDPPCYDLSEALPKLQCAEDAMQNVPTSKQPSARRTVTIHDLRTGADEIVHEVRDTGEPIDVTDRGAIVARIEPANDVETEQPRRFATMEEWLRATEALAEEIGRRWPKGV